MKRIPKKASSVREAYFELTKPSITFLILKGNFSLVESKKTEYGFFTSILSTLLKIIVPIEILVSSFVFLITTDASSN